jgi:hypothetical protein
LFIERGKSRGKEEKMSLDVLNAKVKTFFDNVDPSKKQEDRDQWVFTAYSKGEPYVNGELMRIYGMDLNTFANNNIPRAIPVQGYAQPQQQQYAQQPQYVQQPQYAQQQYVQQYGGRPVMQTGGTPVVIVEQGGGYGYNNGYQQRQADADLCFCLTALFACLICFEF